MEQRRRHASPPAGSTIAATRARRGFTAIELTAVATIITILALILLPIVRKRVDQARLVAAEDDMRTIEIAQVLARADTGQFFRISDLDNPPVDAEDLADAVASGQETRMDALMGLLPAAYWNRPVPDFALNGTETSFDIRSHPLVSKWTGPYTRFSNTKFQSLEALVAARPQMFRSVNIGVDPAVDLPLDTTNGLGGPILIIRNALASGVQDDIIGGETTAIDPWGAPYVFFGPERVQTNLPVGIEGNESNFGIAAVYTLGPDGLPGDGQLNNETLYYREQGVIGTGDDIGRTF